MIDSHGNPIKRIQPAENMDDETFMKHFERRHAHELKMKFTTEPDQGKRRMRARAAWEAYHETIHRIATNRNNHWHGEREDEDDD